VAALHTSARLVVAAAFVVATAIVPSISAFSDASVTSVADPNNGCLLTQRNGSNALSCAPTTHAGTSNSGAPSEMGLTQINSGRAAGPR
jgi:hypothetical protein